MFKILHWLKLQDEILFSISIKDIEIHDHIIDNCISGICNFTGPQGSGILIEILGRTNDDWHLINTEKYLSSGCLQEELISMDI